MEKEFRSHEKKILSIYRLAVREEKPVQRNQSLWKLNQVHPLGKNNNV